MHKDLENAIANDNLVLFVGAGMSMPLGFPSWSGLMTKILKKLEEEYKGKSPLDFSFFLSQGNDLDVLKTLGKLEGEDFKSRVKSILYDELIDLEYSDEKLKNHRKLWQISDKIVTSNYDTSLEDTKSSKIQICNNNNTFQQKKITEGNPYLYKIHGNIANPNTCILFPSDYEDLYKKENVNRKTFENLFLNKTILFIGFSFDDPFITELIKNLYDIYDGYGKQHFIILNKTKDLREYNVHSIEVKDWNESFDKILDELVAFKEANQTTLPSIKTEGDTVDISTEKDLVKLKNIFEQKKKELEDLGELEIKEAFRELSEITERIQELQTKELDFQQLIPDHNQQKLEYIFDKIFSAEKLSTKLIQEIRDIRDQHSGKSEWYHRSVLVSALACSIVNSEKLDPNKIDLLIDFTNDSEDKVWQKAITYLFLVLNHLGNKWLRYKSVLEAKLKSLKRKPEIQEALKTIIAFMQFDLQGVSPVNEKVFKNEYFKDSPFNYFLPFYKDNPSAENIYEDDTIEDVEEHIKWLYNSPLSDAFKYLLCNTENIHETDQKEKTEQEEIESKIMIRSMLSIHHAFEPYLNYVNDFLNFYKNYPKSLKEIKQEITVIKITKLKNVLLNTVEEHRIMARQFGLQKQWGKAITHYEALLKIEEKDKSALVNLAQCYDHTKKSDDDKLKIRLLIEELIPENHENLYEISLIYDKKEKFQRALKYLNNAIELDNRKGVYYNIRGIVKRCLKNYKEALLDYDIAIKLDNKQSSYHYNRSITKNYLEDYEGALLDCDQAIKLDNKEARYYNNRSITKNYLKDYESALLDSNQAIKLDNKDAQYYNNRAITKNYLKDYKSALLDCNQAIKLGKKDAQYYNGRAITKNYLKDYESALLDYDKAIKLDDKEISYYENRGNCKHNLKDYEGAILDFDNAIKLDDKKAGFYVDKANSYRRLKVFDKAHQFCDKAIELDLENGRNIGTKAAIYSSEGKEELFYEYLEKAFQAKAKASWLNDDIKEKYKNEKRFQELLVKYNQTLEEED